MRARHLIGGAGYSPDVLRVLFEAFDGAWCEVGTQVSARPDAIEVARASLAAIVLSIAQTRPIDLESIKTAAVDAFRFKHRLPGAGLAWP